MNQAFASGLCNFGAGGAVTCGKDATAEGAGATAIGTGATALGEDTTAIGRGAVARFAGSVAIGAGAQALADPTTAVGNNAIASGNNAVALGANTRAAGDNSVALGQGSVATRANTVSVGDAGTGLVRSISNVAPGVAGTDAVNVDQLQRAGQQVLGEARDYSNRGVAAAMALPSIPMLAPGERYAGAAVGHYGGKSALGVALGYQIDQRWNVGAALSAAQGSGRIGARLQAGMRW